MRFYSACVGVVFRPSYLILLSQTHKARALVSEKSIGDVLIPEFVVCILIKDV